MIKFILVLTIIVVSAAIVSVHLLQAKKPARSYYRQRQSENTLRLQVVDAREAIPHVAELPAEDHLKAIFRGGSAGEVLRAIDQLNIYPELSLETRNVIASALCRFRDRDDAEFELIRAKLRRTATEPVIDLSSCES